jgi:hypothetical protein
MNNQEMITNLAREKYMVTFGVSKRKFDKMLKILESAYALEYAAGRRKPRLTVLDKLALTLSRYHDLRTMEDLACDYGVSKTCISSAVKWVEWTLAKNQSDLSVPKCNLSNFPKLLNPL